MPGIRMCIERVVMASSASKREGIPARHDMHMNQGNPFPSAHERGVVLTWDDR